jgi:hypothetical protein
MKLLAETQMRRLNAIVGILSDPELRHQYDDQLKHAAIVPLAASGPRTIRRNDFNLHFGWERRRLLPWWIWTPLGAVVLTIGVVWFWADDVGSSFSNQTQSYAHRAVQDKAARKNGRRNSNNIASESDKDQNAVNVTSRTGNAPCAPASDGGVRNAISAGLDKSAAKNTIGRGQTEYKTPELHSAIRAPLAKAVRSHPADPLRADKSNGLADANIRASPRTPRESSAEAGDTGGVLGLFFSQSLMPRRLRTSKRRKLIGSTYRHHLSWR